MTAAGQLIGIKDLFKESWGTVRTYWKSLLALYLLSIAIYFGVFLSALVAGGVIVLSGMLILIAVLVLVVLAALLVVGGWLTAAQIKVVAEQRSFGESLSLGKPLAVGMAGLLLLAAVIVVGGSLLFIVPGIIFALWLSQTSYVYAIEGTSVGGAMSRSKSLVSGRMWALLGRYLVLIVLVLLVNAVISGLFPSVEAGSVLSGSEVDWRQALESLSKSAESGNPVASLLQSIFSIFMSMFSLAYGYHLYRSLAAIDGAEAEKV